MKDKVLQKTCIIYNIDPLEGHNLEILNEAYIDQVNLNEDFLRSIGIYVDSLEERIGKRYNETKKRMARFKGSDAS